MQGMDVPANAGRYKMYFGGSPGLWEGTKCILDTLRETEKVQNVFWSLPAKQGTPKTYFVSRNETH
jgi:hypothetical protein